MLTSNDQIGNNFFPHPAAGSLNARISFFGAVVHRTALAISIAASLSLLGWVMVRCRIGFDFTDEGFYLNWISNPWNYRVSVSQFGFVYYPLYKLLGGDIVLLRQANVLIFFALAWSVSIALFSSVSAKRKSTGNTAGFGKIGIALVVAAGSLSFLDIWLPTPNYNSLTFQSLMVAAIGALLADQELSKSSLAGWILIGIGGGLAFLAKPTSAAMLGCIVIAYLFIAGKFNVRRLLISALIAALSLIGAALAIDGSLADFVRRNIAGMALARRLTPEYTVFSILRWDGITLAGNQKAIFTWLLIVAFVTATLAFLRSELARLAASVAIAISVWIIATVSGLPSPAIFGLSFQPVQFSAVATGFALAGIAYLLRTRRRLSRGELAASILLVALPYAYAFGTGNNYGAAAARVGLFWFLAGFVVCVAAADNVWRRLLPSAALALVVSLEVLSVTMESPYRQTEALRLQMDPAEIPPGRSRLFLSHEAAAYVRDLNEIAYGNGFRTGAPVLDLTGASPGSLYAMGARPLAVAWTLGGYQGSTDFLAAVLEDESCEAIAKSWVLTEPNAPERFSVEMLRQFGIDIASDFVDVGSVKSFRGSPPQKFERRLLRPVRSDELARVACEDAKRTRMNLQR